MAAESKFHVEEALSYSVWSDMALPTLDPDRCFLVRKFTQQVAPLGMSVVFFREGYQQQQEALELPYQEPRWSSLRSRLHAERAQSGLLSAVRSGSQPMMRLGLVEHCVVVGTRYMRRCLLHEVGKSVFSYKGFFVRVTLRRASNSRPNQPSQAGLKFNTALTTTVDFYLDSGVSDFLVKRTRYERSVCIPWDIGDRIRSFYMSAEDLTQGAYWAGRILGKLQRDARDPMRFSPWETIEIYWDEEEQVSMMNIWEIEPVRGCKKGENDSDGEEEDEDIWQNARLVQWLEPKLDGALTRFQPPEFRKSAFLIPTPAAVAADVPGSPAVVGGSRASSGRGRGRGRGRIGRVPTSRGLVSSESPGPGPSSPGPARQGGSGSVAEIERPRRQHHPTIVHNPCAAEADWNNDYCAVCKQLGEMVCCDGTCLRSFHPRCLNSSDGPSESDSEGALWYCPMCRDGWAVCADCGEVGLAEKELFICSVPSCGNSFHLACLMRQREVQWGVDAGRTTSADHPPRSLPPFVCSSHRCTTCRGDIIDAENPRNAMPAAMTCLNCPAAFHPPCLPINTPTAGERNVLCASCVQQISSGMRTGRPAPLTRRVGVPPAQVIQETVDQRGAALRQRGDCGDASFVDRLTDGAIAEVMSAVRGGVIAVEKHRRLSNTLGSSSSLEPSDAAAQPPQHGVEQIGVTGLWLSTVRVRGVLRSIGHFGSAAAAARARDLVMLHLWPTTAHATLKFPAGDYAEGSEWMALYTSLKRTRGHPVAKSETDSRDVARPPPSAGAEVAGGVAIVSTTQNAVPPALMLSARVESSIEMASALPDCVRVVCNTVFGLLLTQSMTILTEDAQLKVSIAEFVRRGYGGHLAGGLDLIHVVMEDGAVGSPLDLWVAACSQGSAVVFEAHTGPASEDDGKPKRNGVWTVPAKRRNGWTPSRPAATANGQSRPQQAATVAAEHSTAAINDVQAAMGPEGEGRSLAIFDSAAQPSFNGLGSDDGRGEELESDEERPRKRGRPRRTPQQGEDRAGRQCGYRGVKYMRRRGKWSAFITYHGDLQPLGTFDSEEAAARAYDWAALDLYGRSAVLNFSREEYQTGAPVPSGNIQAESAPIVADSERRSTFMGVYWNAQIGLWSAYATQRGGRRKHRTEIGSFVNEEDAARAYDRHVLETQGPSAITNYPAADYDGLSFAYVGGTMPHLPR